jgi:hypothetical protein
VLAALMASTWAHGWSSTCHEVIYLGELPVGLSTLLSRGLRSPSAAHRPPGVEPPRTCHLSQSHVGPQRRVQRASSEVVLLSRWTAVGLSTLQSWGPHSLSAVLYGPVSSSLHVHVLGPGLLLLKLKGSSFLACRKAQHAVMLLPDPRHAARGRLSSPTSRSTYQAPPHVLMLRTQAVGMKSCRPRSGLLTWHPSASTADSLLRDNILKIWESHPKFFKFFRTNFEKSFFLHFSVDFFSFLRYLYFRRVTQCFRTKKIFQKWNFFRKHSF